MDDVGLVAAVAAGEDSALRELFLRHAPWLAARLRTVLPTADAEDVVQETFIAVWRGSAGFRPDGPVAGWIWGIARRQAALLLRRRGPATLALSALDSIEAGWLPDPTEALLTRAELEVAVAALGPPGSPHREAWQLMYVEDLPVAQAADLMGVPTGTAKSRAWRARLLLRRVLYGQATVEGGDR
jgi:RNA polymerase sigma-70 factor (ECF subfamily)